MAAEDAVRWNSRYAGAPPGWYDAPRSFLLENLNRLPASGMALDLAMGVGQNAAVLVERGLTVVGIDISATAVLQAHRRTPRLLAVIADLQQGFLPAARFDVILNFYYLQRSLFTRLPDILNPGGLVLVETLTRDILAVKPDIEPAFLLEAGELRNLFAGWDILLYREGWVASDHGNRKAVASLCARLPAG